MKTSPVGVIGLGAARSLLRAGFPTHGCDVRADLRQAFAAEGGVAAADPAALGGPCRVLIILVLNEAQTDEVLFGPKGAAAALAPGSLVIASATVSPNLLGHWASVWRRGEFLCSMRRFRGERPRPGKARSR